MNKKLDTRRDAWNYDYVGPKQEKPQDKSDVIADVKDFLFKPKLYHHWVYAADDSMNKVLKTVVYCLFGYGFYCVAVELYAKYFV